MVCCWNKLVIFHGFLGISIWYQRGYKWLVGHINLQYDTSSGNRPKEGQYIDSIDLPAVHQQPAQENHHRYHFIQVIRVTSDPAPPKSLGCRSLGSWAWAMEVPEKPPGIVSNLIEKDKTGSFNHSLSRNYFSLFLGLLYATYIIICESWGDEAGTTPLTIYANGSPPNKMLKTRLEFFKPWKFNR